MFYVGIIFWVVVILRYMTTELAFTNKRVIAKTGVISRMLNYGSLVISGAGNPQAPILGISSPTSFRQSLNEFMHSD